MAKAEGNRLVLMRAFCQRVDLVLSCSFSGAEWRCRMVGEREYRSQWGDWGWDDLPRMVWVHPLHEWRMSH